MMMNVSFVIAMIAGIESTAKTMSEDSINNKVKNVVVIKVLPLDLIKNFLPS